MGASERMHLHQDRIGMNTFPAPLHAVARHFSEPAKIFRRFSSAQPHSLSPGVQSFAATGFTHSRAQFGIFFSWASQSFAVADARATKVASATGKRNFMLKLGYYSNE